jgi:6-phosphogluconolactonase
MKFRKFGQIILASVVSLGLAAGVTACTSKTADFVYVTSSKNDPGQINVYTADINSGTLHNLPISPYTERYRNPVAVVVGPDGKNLYVAFRDDNVIQQYGIGTDGKLYPQNTYNTPGSFPISIALNAAGTYLYVLDTYEPGFSNASPGPGALVVYPINSDGSLSAPLTNGTNPFYAVGMIPTGTENVTSVNLTSSLVNVLNNGSTVLVAGLTKGGTQGAIYAFSVGSSGALTPFSSVDSTLGTDAGPGIYAAGTQPSAVTSDLTSSFVYVTDYATNRICGYSVQQPTGLSSLTGSPCLKAPVALTGNNPVALTIEPRNKFLYVANYTDSSISGYQIGSNGSLTALSSGTIASTGTAPACIFVEPRFGRYLYTADFLGNTVSGYQINPDTGALFSAQKSPFGAAAQPTCGAALAHGKISL